MLSILNLKDEAYLIGIKDYLEEHTGKTISLTSVHLPLNRRTSNLRRMRARLGHRAATAHHVHPSADT